MPPFISTIDGFKAYPAQQDVESGRYEGGDMISGSNILRGARALGMVPVGVNEFRLTRLQLHEIDGWLVEHTLIDEAIHAAHLAIDEYYNGDRQWAERWLLTAYDANQKASDDGK